jgi:primosomal protein N' (replication factor Y)
VIIQTLNPDHPAITYAQKQDYDSFYKYELEERRAEHMPPLTYLLQLTVGYASAAAAERAAQKLKNELKQNYKNIHVRGPSPAFHEHRGALYYQQLVVSSSQRSVLAAIARSLPDRWQYTLDPLNLL